MIDWDRLTKRHMRNEALCMAFGTGLMMFLTSPFWAGESIWAMGLAGGLSALTASLAIEFFKKDTKIKT